MGRWQLDSKTKMSLRYHLAKATWGIKCSYNYSKIEIFLLPLFLFLAAPMVVIKQIKLTPPNIALK